MKKREGFESSKQSGVLDEFRDRIRREFGDRVRQVILFGSRARGDASADSDYDLLLVMDRVNSEMRGQTAEIGGEFLLEYGSVLSLFPISEEEFRDRTHSPFLMNIRREGVAV